MKKEFKRIKRVSKRIIGRKKYKKIKKISDFTERTQGLKYLVSSSYKLKLLELEHQIKRIKKDKKHLILDSKLAILTKKIKIFESSYEKRDYLVVKKLIKEIENLIKKCSDS